MRAATKLKVGFFLVVIALFGYGIYPHITPDGTDKAKTAYGPSKPGIDKENGCRNMTLEVEGVVTHFQRSNGMISIDAVLSADLGSAGRIPAVAIKLPDIHIGHEYYKRAFCAKPGDPLRAQVTPTIPVLSVDCYFASGPNINDPGTVDSGVVAGGGPGGMNMTWCAGVVPA